MHIRPVEIKDLEAVRWINEFAVPHVNRISFDDLHSFMKISSFFHVTELNGKVAGFMIVLPPGEQYDSLNYRYFSEHYTNFDYMDRIVIGEEYRGQGLGSALYHYLFKETKQERVTCEVNTDPPNPGSMRFHKALGFRVVGEQETEGGEKRVALMVREAS